MNTRKLLVSGLMFTILFSACAQATLPTPTAVSATVAPTSVPPTPAPTAVPIALGPIVGRYYDSGSIYTLTPLDLLPDGSYYYGPSADDFQAGIFNVSQDQVTFTEEIGACGSVPGIYTWSLEEDALKLTVVDDECTSRRFILISKLRKLPAQELYADFVWKTSAQEPMYVTVDQQGNIYTSTGRPGGFSKFDSTGNLLQHWPMPSRWMQGITLDALGNIYVANWDEAQVQKFDPNGNLLISWGVSEVSGVSNGLAGPVGMGMDAQGNLYVVVGADGGTVDHYIEKYDPQGKLLGSWANSGLGEGEFKPTNVGGGIRLEGLAVDPAGNTYLADPQENLVNKYDANGNFLYSLTGDGEQKFWHPFRVTLDSQQNVFVIDDTHIIWKFDREGKFVGKWRTVLAGDMAFTKNGNLLIADRAGILAEVTLPTP